MPVRVIGANGVWPSTGGGAPLTIEENGVALATRGALNFADNLIAVDNPAEDRVDVTGTPGPQGPPGSPGSVNFMEDTVTLAPRTGVNFSTGIVATDNPAEDRIDVTVTGVQGPEGPQGDPGPQGPAGPAGSGGGTTPEEHGAEGDGVVLTDVSITSGTNVLTSPSGPFVAGDVGKIVAVLGAGTGSPLSGRGFTITGFTSATQVTLNTTAGTTVGTGKAAFGTDDAAAFQAACDALNVESRGGTVECAARLYMIGTRVVQPGGVLIKGAGIDYNGDDPFPLRGTVLCAGGALTNSVLRMGDVQYTGPITGTPFDSGHTMPQLETLCVFGADIVAECVSLVAARWKVDRCQFGGGNTSQLNIPGQNGEFVGNIINGHSRGAGIINTGPDNTFSGNQIRGWRTIGFDAQGSNGQFSGNKIYCNNSEDSVATCAFRLGTPGWGIHNNIFGDSNMLAPHILIPATTNARDVNIVGNDFYHTSGTGMTPVCIRIDTTAAATRGIHVVGNTAHCGQANNIGYAALVDVTGTNAVEAWNITGNTLTDITTLFTVAGSQAPAVCEGNVWRATRSGVTATFVDVQRGRAVLNGTGAATTFTIPHSIGSTPATVIVTPGTAVAAATHFATVDAAQITVTYMAAPAVGTGNVVLNWYVSKI